MNITLIGFMGTGKSAVGRKLARRLNWKFVDVDALIESMAGTSIPRIFAEHSEAVFRRLERRAIRRAVKADQQVIATGGGAFVDAANRSLLRTVGPVICLTAIPATIVRRVGPTRARRPMLAGGEVRSRIERLLQQRAPAYAKADLTIATDGASADDVVERIWEAIGPWVCKSWHYLLTHSEQLIHRYGGQYIAVIDDRIVGVGPTQLKAYQEAMRQESGRRPAGRRHSLAGKDRAGSVAGADVAIFYIPLRKEAPTAL